MRKRIDQAVDNLGKGCGRWLYLCSWVALWLGVLLGGWVWSPGSCSGTRGTRYPGGDWRGTGSRSPTWAGGAATQGHPCSLGQRDGQADVHGADSRAPVPGDDDDRHEGPGGEDLMHGSPHVYEEDAGSACAFDLSRWHEDPGCVCVVFAPVGSSNGVIFCTTCKIAADIEAAAGRISHRSAGLSLAQAVAAAKKGGVK